MLGERENLSATDNQVVGHSNFHQHQRLHQSLGNSLVCLTWCNLPGRVVMGKYHRRSVKVQGAFHHFPGMNFSVIEGNGANLLI